MDVVEAETLLEGLGWWLGRLAVWRSVKSKRGFSLAQKVDYKGKKRSSSPKKKNWGKRRDFLECKKVKKDRGRNSDSDAGNFLVNETGLNQANKQTDKQARDHSVAWTSET